MIKQADIAQKTGYSLSVISRALSPVTSKSDTVSPKTKEVIKQIARQMGYSPNLQASCLRRGKTPSIGVFLPAWQTSLIAELIMGISDAAAEMRIPLNFHFGQSEESYNSFIEEMHGNKNTGIISYPPRLNSNTVKAEIIEKINYYKKWGKALFLNSSIYGIDSPSINMDEEEGGRLAAEYLFNNGCQSFSVLRFPGRLSDARQKGFESFLNKHGLKADFHTQGGPDVLKEKEVYSFLEMKLKQTSNHPHGIFSAMMPINDFTAYFCIKNGIKINKDIFIVGYDSMPPNKQPVTIPSIVQPFYEQGKMAMYKLSNMLDGKEEKAEILKPYLKIPEAE